MSVIRDRNGTYYVQQRVAPRLQEAVARVLDIDASHRVFLKKSLGTKDPREAKAAAVHVLADFSRILGQAEALLKEQPLVTELADTLIKRMAESYYATLLADDDRERRDGTGSEPVFQRIAAQLDTAGVGYETPFAKGDLPEAGLSDREFVKHQELVELLLPAARTALAKGDITVIRDELDELLHAFRVNLDRKSAAYRKLGMAVLTAHVRGLKAIEQRNAGEVVETPQSVQVAQDGLSGHSGGTVLDALTEWTQYRPRPQGTVAEAGRSVEMFVQLHGNMAVIDIKRRHAVEYRKALMDVPKLRKGNLLTASLPELAEWGRQHPEAQKIAASTINKQLGAVQAVCVYGSENALIPDDAQWADAFSKLRLPVERSERTSFKVSELQLLFDTIIFTAHELPNGAHGAAGFWLPLLALFTGARQAELASLEVSSVQLDAETGASLLYFESKRSKGKHLKTKTSERVVPVHPELVRLGLREYVQSRHDADGPDAWLFPAVAPDRGRAGIPAWSKWFGRYLRDIGVTDKAKVFHSFRHTVKDALRRGRADHEAREGLIGHAHASSVSGNYGAKEMLDRFTAPVLVDAINRISYPGLDLSRVRPLDAPTSSRGTKGT